MPDELTAKDTHSAFAGEQRPEESFSPPHDVNGVYVAESAIHGRGVFAGRRFRQHETIGTYRGLPTNQDDTYVLWLHEEGEWRGIDGTGSLRFLNHASEPNADFDGCELYALRDIAPGEEITFHYGEEWEDDPGNPPGRDEEE